MSKHTPGPWRVKPMPSNTVGCRTIQANKGGTHKQGQWKTSLASTWGLDNDEEDRANARLIAAAPELLKACKLLATFNAVLVKAARATNVGECLVCEGELLIEDFGHAPYCPVPLALAAIALAEPDGRTRI